MDTIGKSPRLVGIVVSYMDTPQRWNYFEEMMLSICDQSAFLDTLYIGMSFPNIELAHEYENPLRKLIARMNPLVIELIRTSKPRTQGEMWYKLDNTFPKIRDENTWVVFGDDDDLWHPDRVKHYSEGVETAIRMPYPVSDVRSLFYTESKSVDEKLHIGTVLDVDLQLEAGALMKRKTTAGKLLEGSIEEIGGNYVDHCVTGRIFHEFIHMSNNFMRSNNQYDVMFQSFIATYKGFKNIIMKTESWMYFWRRHSESICTRMNNQQLRVKNNDSAYMQLTVENYMSKLGSWKDTLSLIYRVLIPKNHPNPTQRKTRIDSFAREFAQQYPLIIQQHILMDCVVDQQNTL